MKALNERKVNKKKSSEENGTYVVLLKTAMKILIIALLAITLIKATTFVYNESYKIFNDKPNVNGEKVEYTIHIAKGTSIDKIADSLEINGIIADKFAFSVQAKLSKLSKTMVIGAHKVDSYMTMREIIENLSSEGTVINE